MCNKQKRIYSLDEFMRKYKFIPKPVITQDHKWMIDEYIWYCIECDLEISQPAEIRKEIFDKSFPVSVIGDIASRFLAHRSGLTRANYWLNIFAFGFRRESVVIPQENILLNGYFRVFEPENSNDYVYASNRLLEALFSDYYGEYKKIPELNKMNLYGRLEAFNLLRELFSPAFRGVSQKHSGQETWLMNKLMKNSILPTDKRHDPLHDLYNLGGTDSSFIVKLGTKERHAFVSFEVNYNIFAERFINDQLTENILYTMLFSFHSVLNRDTSNYYNDFNIIWNKEREVNGELRTFYERFYDAYEVLNEMIGLAGSTGNLKAKLYTRMEGGIDARFPITQKILNPTTGQLINPDGLYTDFKVHEISIDPANPSKAIISILLWMMLEPNIFTVVEYGPSGGLIYLDIYNLFDQSHIDSGTVAPQNRIDQQFLWTDSDPVFTTTRFNEFKERYDKLFEYGDIMHFLGFHNHELSSRFDNIIDYIKDKVLKYFVQLGILNDKSQLFELR